MCLVFYFDSRASASFVGGIVYLFLAVGDLMVHR
jgi:hypothetical protein